MLCAGKGKYAKLSRTMSQNSSDCVSVSDSDDEDDATDDVFESTTQRLDAHYFSDVITDQDFQQIHPNKARFVKQLKAYVAKRQAVLGDKSITEDEKRRDMLDQLPFVTENGVECKLEDLG